MITEKLSVEESPQQAAEHIVADFRERISGFDWADLIDAITTAIQAAVEAERERGRQASDIARALREQEWGGAE